MNNMTKISDSIFATPYIKKDGIELIVHTKKINKKSCFIGKLVGRDEDKNRFKLSFCKGIKSTINKTNISYYDLDDGFYLVGNIRPNTNSENYNEFEYIRVKNKKVNKFDSKNIWFKNGDTPRDVTEDQLYMFDNEDNYKNTRELNPKEYKLLKQAGLL